jgi:uncharacterized protein YukJ
MKRDFELTKYVIVENKKLRKRIKNLENILFEMSNFREVLTPKEIELEYGISRKTLSRYRSEGLKLIQPKRNGKILVKRTEIEKFFNSKKLW